jgi:hypothetical protein
MKKRLLIFIILAGSFLANAQTLLIRENFQDWKAQDSAMNYSVTKLLADGKSQGTFISNYMIVAPLQSIGSSGKAEGNGNPSNGRVAIKGAKNYLQLPELPSIGLVKIKASVGTDQKEFKIQVLKGSSFVDVPGTLTACSKSPTKMYAFDMEFSKPTVIRILPTSGSNLYIWDIEIYSYSK